MGSEFPEPMHKMEDAEYDLLAFQSLMMFIAWWNEITEKGENVSHLVPPPPLFVPRSGVGKDIFRELMKPANIWVKHTSENQDGYPSVNIEADQKVARDYVRDKIEEVKTEHSMKEMMKQIDEAIETINVRDE